MKDIFWEEYPDNGFPESANGPCMKHGRSDCVECCPEFVDEYDPWSDDDDYIAACGEQP